MIFNPAYTYKFQLKTTIENAHKLLDYYIGSVGNISEENVQGMVDMYTDAWFAYGHHRTVNYLTQYGVPTFQYIFAYPGQLSFFNLALKEIYNFTISGEFSFTNAFDPDSHGVCHGDELIYLFEPFYSHNGDPGLGPLSGDDLGQKIMLFFQLSDSQDSHILSPELCFFFRTQALTF